MSLYRGLSVEARTLYELVSDEKRVLQPFGEGSPYDLLIDLGDMFVRVQCKAGTLDNKIGVVKADLRRTNMNSQGPKRQLYTEDEVDLFAIMDPELGDIYWIPFSEAPKTYMSVRVRPTKNGQSKNVMYGKDCTLQSALDTIRREQL